MTTFEADDAADAKSPGNSVWLGAAVAIREVGADSSHQKSEVRLEPRPHC